MIRWAMIWILLIAGVTGAIGWLIELDLPAWQLQLRYASAITFLLAIGFGSQFQLSRRRFYREKWSFILLIVTIGLFTMSAIG